MKTSALLLLVSCLVSTVTMSIADDFRSHSPTNASAARELQFKNCVPPPKAVTGVWYYDILWKQYRGCTTDYDSKPWIMLNAYRGGGTKGEAWRFKDDEEWDDLPCLKDWTYYGKDGMWVVAKVEGEYTTRGESKPWCALPKYQMKGKQGYQWDYCTCEQA